MRFPPEGERDEIIDYELNLNIRLNGRIHFLNGSFQSVRELQSLRNNVLYELAAGSSGMKLTGDQWKRDPFDTGREKGFLMEWTEEEKYDGLVPYHPLSEMRRFLKYVIENN